MEKQRQREKAYREKRKAKKLAENGGEIVKTKVCPHCQERVYPYKQSTGILFKGLLLSGKAG